MTDYFGGQTSYSYDALGRLTSLSNPYLYIVELGYYGDGNAGMYLLTQRWYNPVVGRFVVRDLFQNISMYDYTSNNPVNGWDPQGLYTIQLPPNLSGWRQRIENAFNQLCNNLKDYAKIRDCILCRAGKEAGSLVACLKRCCKFAGTTIIVKTSREDKQCGAACGHAVLNRRGQLAECKIVVCENALLNQQPYFSGGCGPLGSVISHELIHSCGYWGEYYPWATQSCLFGDPPYFPPGWVYQ